MIILWQGAIIECKVSLICSRLPRCSKSPRFTLLMDPDHLQNSWWRHQKETFSALLAICAGNSPVQVNSPYKGQWRGALMFSLICVWINGWVNNHEAGDLRRYRVHYVVIVMWLDFIDGLLILLILALFWLRYTGIKQCYILFSTFHILNVNRLVTSSVRKYPMDSIVRFVLNV